MANSGRITGKDLYIAFNGTDISADFTSVSFSEEGDLVDVTAGDDTYHYYVPTDRVDGTCDYEGYYDSAGSVAWTALPVNTAGTLTIAPLGTAATNPKWEWSRVIVQSRSPEIPFDGGITVSATFQFSSALTQSSY